MMRKLPGVLVVGVILLVAAGCGGSSSGGGSSPSTSTTPSASAIASICQRLANDAQALSQLSSQAGNNPSKIAATLRADAQKLASDASGGPAGMQDGANKLAQVLTAAAGQISHNKQPDLSKFSAKLRIAESELDHACPSVTPQGSPAG